MAISIRQLFGKLRSGVKALKDPTPPPVQINFSRFKQTPRVRRSIRETRPLTQQAQRASQNVRLDRVIRDAPKTLPRARFSQKAKTPVGRFALSIPQELINAPRDVFAGSLGLGANIADVAARKRPTNVLGNIGAVGLGFTNVAGGGKAAALARAGRQGGLRQLAKRGAVEGSRLGAAGGTFQGLTQEGSTSDKLKAAGQGGVAGAVIGAGLGVASPLIGRGLQRHKEAGRPFGLSVKSVGEGPTVPKKVPGTGAASRSSAQTLEDAAKEVKLLGPGKPGILQTQAAQIPVSTKSLQKGVAASSDNPIRKLARGESVELHSAVINKRNQLIKELRTESFAPDKSPPPGEKANIFDKFRTPAEVYDKFGQGKGAEALRFSEIRAKREIDGHITQIQKWVEDVGDRQEVVFDALDGKKVKLNPTEKRVVAEIRDYFSTWADRLKLPKDRRVTDYITHIFEEDLIKKEFDPDLAKLIEGQVPGSVFNPFLQAREGAINYKKDIGLALSAYAKRGVRKANFDPVLAVFKDRTKKMELSQVNFIKNNLERVNLRPTQTDNLLDNFIKGNTPVGYNLGQRPTLRLSQSMRRAGFRGALGGNVGSAVKNLTQGVNTYSALGEQYTMRGYVRALTRGARKELENVGVLESGFIDDQTVSVYKSLLKKMDSALFFAFEKAEQINRGAAYYGAKQKALDAGKSQADAILEGLALARKTQFTFGAVDTPEILSSDIAKTFGQFQSFNLKQAEFLKNMIKNKEWAGLLRWTAANAILVGTAGKLIGFDAADTVPFSGIITGQTKFGQTPAIGAIGGVGTATINTASQALGREAPFRNRFGQPIDFNDAGKSLVAVIPGGVQARKTIQGLGAADRGFSKSASGRARFPVENKLRAAVFGQFNNPFGQFYFDNNLTPLGDKDTLKLENLIKAGQDPKKAWQRITEKRVKASQATKIKDLRKEKLTPGERTRRIREIRRDTDTLLKQLKRL